MASTGTTGQRLTQRVTCKLTMHLHTIRTFVILFITNLHEFYSSSSESESEEHTSSPSDITPSSLSSFSSSVSLYFV